MTFPFRMAWRETRAAWRQFLGFFACIALGVAALVAVGAFGITLDRTLRREAKALTGGDVELRSARALPGEIDTALDELAATGAAITRVRELVGMARNPASGKTVLVEVKAVDAAYPLYGALVLDPPRRPAELLAGDGVLVQPQLLERLDARVGDRIMVGAAAFTITGVLRREPERAGGFALGPRLLIGAPSLDRTQLVRLGSRLRHRALVRLPDAMSAADAREMLARRTADAAVRVRTYEESQAGLRRFFSELTTYLGLVGLISLLVGGIGVAFAVRAFVRRRLTTIAVLRCLGADARVLFVTYLLQTQTLAALGSLAGVGLGLAAQPALAAVLAGVVPFALEAQFELGVAGRGLGMGLLTALIAALWPLLEIRHVRPAIILRRQVDSAARPRRRPWLAVLPIALGLAGIALWQARSVKIGAIFLGAGVAAILTLTLLAYGAVHLARVIPRPATFAWRQGLAGLHRPGGEASAVIVAVGVGVMLLVSTALLQLSLARRIDHEQRREAPSFFFVDVQPDQREAFLELVRSKTNGRAPALTPVVRSRLAAINGVPITRETVDGRARSGDGAGFFIREYVLTFTAEPPANNEILRGRWWTAGEAAARPRISVEEDAAKHLGVDVGGRLTFDVQGLPVEAEVMSVRKVDWQSLSTNFFVIFSPGALEEAPLTYVATARVPAVLETELQEAVVAAFPNVTAVPLRELLERIAAILAQLAFAIRAMALFSIGAGLVVMVGTLTASRYQRLYESVILRTLGATRGAVARAFAVEYACLGAAAGLAGSLLATALSWVLLEFVLHVPWAFAPGALVLGVVSTIVVSVIIGFMATFRLLGQKPLAVLRQE